MRKITLNPAIGPKGERVLDFHQDWIVIRDDRGELCELNAEKQETNNRKYTLEQLEAIWAVNNVLQANKREPMTEEEIEYLLYPFGKEKKPTTEELQALAGFRVEKTIVKIGE